ncbi:FUSC family protein [Nocardia brasiliensis]
MPPVQRVVDQVFAMPTGEWRWAAALRAAGAYALPAAALVLTGLPGSALFALFGAFAVLYGEGRVHWARLRRILITGGILCATAALGVGTGAAVRDPGAFGRLAGLAVLTIVATAAVYATNALRSGPPGALFFVLVCAGAWAAVSSGAAVESVLYGTTSGVAGAIAVALIGLRVDARRSASRAVAVAVDAVHRYVTARAVGNAGVLPRHHAATALVDARAVLTDARGPAGISPVRRLNEAETRFHAAALPPGARVASLKAVGPLYRLHRAWHIDSHPATTALRVAIAVSASGAISLLLGSTRPHWAMLTALIVLQAGPDVVRGRARLIHRMAGTVAGSGLLAVIVAFDPGGYPRVLICAALLFAIDLLVARNYGLAVVFITPVALLAAGGNDAITTEVMLDRLTETAVGVVVAASALHWVMPRAHRRDGHWTTRRLILFAVALGVCDPNRDDQSLSRRTFFEIAECIRGATDAAHNEPTWAGEHWKKQAALVDICYDRLIARRMEF